MQITGYANLRRLGELYAELNGPTRGRKIVDAQRTADGAEVWVGSFYLCYSIPRAA